MCLHLEPRASGKPLSADYCQDWHAYTGAALSGLTPRERRAQTARSAETAASLSALSCRVSSDPFRASQKSESFEIHKLRYHSALYSKVTRDMLVRRPMLTINRGFPSTRSNGYSYLFAKTSLTASPTNMIPAILFM